MLRPTNPTSNLLIAIIDNRQIVRIGIKQAVDMFYPSAETLEVIDLTDLEQKTATKLPDIILFGTRNLLSSEVVAHVRKLRQQNIHYKIVLYDHRNASESILSFFQERIDGYLTEDFDVKNLQDCLSKIQTGQLYVSQDIANRLLTFKLDYKRQKATTLSEMESRVAQYLLKGVGVSVIAKTLDRRTSTISTVKAKIFKKMKVDNIIDLARILESA